MAELARIVSTLRARDPDLAATRRAGRLAVIGPAGLLVGLELLGRPAFGTFAMLGSVALLGFVDFAGRLGDRVTAQVALVLTTAGLVCLGTAVSQVTWLAVAVAFVAATAILFAGVISSVFAAASTSLLVSILLPVSLRAPPSAIPDRLGGWLLAGAASVLAIRFLWPAPAREALRTLAAEGCARLARQLRAEAACRRDASATERIAGLRQDSAAAAAKLRRTFLATPYRPAGLSTSSRTLVRIVDRVVWLDRVFDRVSADESPASPTTAVCELTEAAADVLDDGADLLVATGGDPSRLAAALERLESARRATEANLTSALSAVCPPDAAGLVSAVEPSFRAHEISYLAAAIATDIQLARAAAGRVWWQQLLGRQPELHGPALSSVRQRAAAHLDRHSVWLHNSLRGGVALSVAVLVALLSDVQHAFWLVFGTLAVLRSNALSTGQNAVRAAAGTVLGILIGGGLVAIVGADRPASWILLVPGLAMVALAPAAISFTAGQASFTTTLLILNNIVTPAGWSAGLIRFEDVGIGVLISASVGLLLWPRGASRALAHAIADGMASSVEYLRAAVDYGISRCDARGPAATPPPVAEGRAAAAAGRRLDDAFRGFVAERGTKRLPLADVAALTGGVSLLRLTGDAVAELWAIDAGGPGVDRAATREELAAAGDALTAWYAEVARALDGSGPMPTEARADPLLGGRLVEIARRDLTGGDGRATATAVRAIWTADHLDATRRLEAQIAGPAASVADFRSADRRPWRRRSAAVSRRSAYADVG